MALWSVRMLERPGVYPMCSYEACYEGIQVVGRGLSNKAFVVFAYSHYIETEPVTSHIVLCLVSPDRRMLYTHGIVENPDNIYYNKSIVPMMTDLEVAARRLNCSVDITPLTKWAYGVYHYSLTRTDM